MQTSGRPFYRSLVKFPTLLWAVSFHYWLHLCSHRYAMASSSISFGNHPDGYASVEPRGNLSCCHGLRLRSHSVSHSLVVLVVVVVTVATHSSTAIRGREIGVSVATASQAMRWEELGVCVVPKLSYQYTKWPIHRVMTGEPEGSTV